MKEEKVSLKTAKIIKEKGFDIGVNHFYTEYLKTRKSDNPSFRMTKGEVELESGYFINNHTLSDLSNINYINYAAPTQSMVQKWLREKYNIDVSSLPKRRQTDNKKIYIYSLHENGGESKISEGYLTHEEAFEIGLQEALKLVN